MAGVVFRFLSGDAMEVNDLQPFPPSSSYLLLFFKFLLFCYIQNAQRKCLTGIALGLHIRNSFLKVHPNGER